MRTHQGIPEQIIGIARDISKNQDIGTYIRNIDYVLKTGGAQIVRYDIQRHQLNIYSKMGQVRLSLPCAEKFKFIMEQFVCNAVKNTREGYVKLGYQKKDSGFYIYCEDTGIGIPKDKQEVIFDKFVKLDNYVQGAGLGLSICKAIADSCHGHIGVVSEGKGKGSTFWFLGPKED